MPPRRGFVPEDLWHLEAVSDPQVSPDGSRVAFVVSTPDRDKDKPTTRIWVADAGGASPARAFSSGPTDNSPRWSPDGRWLAFVAERGHGPQLHLASLSGGGGRAHRDGSRGLATRLVARRQQARLRRADGRVEEARGPQSPGAVRSFGRNRALFACYDGVGWFDSRRSHVFVVAREGGEAIQITDGDWDDADPAWSPEGDRIAFVSDRSPGRFDAIHRDVWVVAAESRRRRRPQRLTRGRGTASSPRWSPDGTTVAYIGHEHDVADGASNTHLLVVGVETPEAPRSLSAPLDRTVWGLAGAPGATLAWSRDGGAVLFIAGDRGTLGVYRSDLDDPRPYLLIGGDRQITALHSSGPTVAFSSQWPTRPSQISCAETDGSGERRVTRTGAATR